MLESEHQQAIRLRLGSKGDLVLFRNNVGVLREETKSGKERFVRFGLLPGSCDLIGILKPTGRFFALEIKKARGRIGEKQQLFIELVREFGGFACVVRDVHEAEAAYERALRGAFE